MKVINDLNLKKQARDLNVRIWQTPGFMFLMLGIITIMIMTAVFFISQNYNDPEVLVLAESIVIVVILVFGNSVISMITQVMKLNQMKSEFVSVASHQLRTPLSAIKWETELLLSDFRKKNIDKKQLRNIENINLLSLKMTRLVNDLLDVARIDQNSLIINKVPVDMELIIKKMIRELSAVVKSKQIEIVFKTSKANQWAFADPEKLQIVIENMLNNSIKYTVNHGKIELKLIKKKSMLIFSIKDNGVGIPLEQHSRIFDKFFRSDNIVKYQTEGTGLGLYIAKNIIEQMGGRVWFESAEGVGSIFSFSIPIAKKRLIKIN